MTSASVRLEIASCSDSQLFPDPEFVITKVMWQAVRGVGQLM
jgi:hypothetical protein